MKLSKYEIRTLLLALEVAIESEQDFIFCNMTIAGRYPKTRRVIMKDSREAVRKSKAFIVRMVKLRGKLRESRQ